ncbi:MAG: hypothetical protein VX737_06430 [Pseudomonadota bacterium]|nr:hypothetical protein [Pseudomonadota bacterium]
MKLEEVIGNIKKLQGLQGRYSQEDSDLELNLEAGFRKLNQGDMETLLRWINENEVTCFHVNGYGWEDSLSINLIDEKITEIIGDKSIEEIVSLKGDENRFTLFEKFLNEKLGDNEHLKEDKYWFSVVFERLVGEMQRDSNRHTPSP